MITKEQQIERYKKCVEYLKDLDLKCHYHVSNYAEGGEYEVGSACHKLSDGMGNIYIFIFDEKGEFTVTKIRGELTHW